MTAAAAGGRERPSSGAAEFSVDSHLTEDDALILTPRMPLRSNVVIAGLDRDFLALLILVDVPACGALS